MNKVNRKLATVKSMLWRWSSKKPNLHPIKLQVTFDKKTRYYPIQYDNSNLFLTKEDWELIQNLSIHVKREKKQIRDAIEDFVTAARKAIKKVSENKQFTLDSFEEEFFQKKSSKDFLDLFQSQLTALRDAERIGTYKSYMNAYNAFKDFRKGRDLAPGDITPELLKAFDTFLTNRKCGKTTVGMYMRSLKVIYNLAADENASLLEKYPFAKRQTQKKGYKIKTGSGHKGEALSVHQLQKFISIETDSNSTEHEAKLLWLFSFYCQGMNIKDIALLKYKDVKESIRYVRAKTKETELTESIMEIPISNNIDAIIASIGNSDKRDENYVFSIIPNGLASTVKRRTKKIKNRAERVDEIIRQKTKMINERLKTLCDSNGMEGVHLTTYWARHTYATLLKESGESIELIRELLGHSNIKTTESYLKRFDLKKKKEANMRMDLLLQKSVD